MNALPRAEPASRSIRTYAFRPRRVGDLIFVGVLALLFGSKGVPQVARRLGTGMREVKDAVAEVDPRSHARGRRGRQAEGNDAAEGTTPQKPAASGDEPPAV